MQLYTVWKKDGTGINEKCLMNTDGDYIGIETTKKYSSTNHYHSKQYKAQYVTVEKAHWCGDIQVYRCLELNEYFSSNEIKILK